MYSESSWHFLSSPSPSHSALLFIETRESKRTGEQTGDVEVSMKESEAGDGIKAHWTQVQLEVKGQGNALPQASDVSWPRAQNFTRSRFGLLGGEGCHLPYKISIVGPKIKGYWGGESMREWKRRGSQDCSRGRCSGRGRTLPGDASQRTCVSMCVQGRCEAREALWSG